MKLICWFASRLCLYMMMKEMKDGVDSDTKHQGHSIKFHERHQYIKIGIITQV